MCLRTGCAKGVLRSEMKSTIYEFGQKDIFFPFATLKSNFLFTSHFEVYFSFFEFFSFSKIEELLRIDTVLWFDTR